MRVKRLISFFLAVLLLSVSMPMATFAKYATSRGGAVSCQNNGMVDANGELLSGGIRAKKTAQKTDNPNEYLVEIEVESLPQPTNNESTILFLVDISTDSKLAEYKNILLEVIPQLLTDNSTTQVALVSVNGNTKQECDFVDYTQKDKLINAVNGLNSTGKSYLEEGIRNSARWLDQTEKTNLNLVIMSEGITGYSSKVASVTSAVNCSEKHLQQFWNITPKYIMPIERIDNVRFSRVDVPSALCQLGRNESHSSKFPLSHNETTLYEAQSAKKSGILIHSVGLGLGDTGRELLTSMQTEGVYETKELAAAHLVSRFATSDSADFLNIALTEDVNNLGEIVPDSLAVSTGELTETGSGFAWDFSLGGKLQYKYVWDVELPDFERETQLSLGTQTRVDYTSSGQASHILLNQPKGVGNYHKVYLQGVLVDKDKNLLNESDQIVTQFSDAKKVSELIELQNQYGVNKWKPSSQITLDSALIETDASCILLPGESAQIQTNLSDEYKNPVFYMPFVNNSLSYTVEHYIEGQTIPFDQKVYGQNGFGTLVTDIEDSPLLPPNHKRDRVDTIPVNIYDNGTIIKVFYGEIPAEDIAYQIYYYLDGDVVNRADATVSKSSPIINFSDLNIDANLPENAELEKVEISNQAVNSSVEITEENNVINVFYKSKLKCTVEIYKDGIVQTGETKYLSSTNPFVEMTGYKQLFAEYELESIFLNDLPINFDNAIQIENTNSILKLYFTPEENTLAYDIVYYQGESEVDRISKTVDKAQPFVLVQADKDRFYDDGYIFDKILFAGDEISTGQNAMITDIDNTIKVIYKKDTSKVYISFIFWVDSDRYLVGRTFEGSDIIDYSVVTGIIPTDDSGNVYTFYSVPPLDTPTFARDLDQIDFYCSPKAGSTLSYRLSYYKQGDSAENTSKRRTVYVDAASPYDSLNVDDLFAANTGDIEIEKLELHDEKGQTDIAIGETFKIRWYTEEVRVYYKENDPVNPIEPTDPGDGNEEEENGGNDGGDNNGGEPEKPSEPNPPEPIDPTDPPINPEPPVDPERQKLTVEIVGTYTANSETIEWRENLSVTEDEPIVLWQLFKSKIHNDKELRLDRMVLEKTPSNHSSIATLGHSGDIYDFNAEQALEETIFEGEKYYFKSGYDYSVRLEYSALKSNMTNGSGTAIDKDGDNNSSNQKTNSSSTKSSGQTNYADKDLNTPPPKLKETDTTLTETANSQNMTSNSGDITLQLPRTGITHMSKEQKTFFKIILLESLICVHYVSVAGYKEEQQT